MRRITWILMLLLSAGVLLAAGCGDDEDEGGGGAEATPEATAEATEDASGGAAGGEAITPTADPGGAISWEPAELSAPAGSVTINLVNESTVPHAVAIEGNGVEESGETVTGGEAPLTADLEAGEYTFYCPVGQHRQNGMEGTLTVE